MNVVQKEDCGSTLLQGAGTLDYQNASHEKPNLQINRRRMLAQAGILGASGALTTLAIPAGATSEHDTEGLLAGLWHGVISSPNNSFPSFETIEQYGEGTWTGSGQPDLTPAGLSSPALGRWERVRQRQFHVVGRFWTYDPSANPTGFGAVDVTITVSKNGSTYHGEGAIEFFDNNGNAVGSATFAADATRIAFS